MCNEGYIFIRGSTCITWDMVFGQTGWYGWMGGLEEWVDGWFGWSRRNGWMDGLVEWVDGFPKVEEYRNAIISCNFLISLIFS